MFVPLVVESGRGTKELSRVWESFIPGTFFTMQATSSVDKAAEAAVGPAQLPEVKSIRSSTKLQLTAESHFRRRWVD
jgi:hypothetical protein